MTGMLSLEAEISLVALWRQSMAVIALAAYVLVDTASVYQNPTMTLTFALLVLHQRRVTIGRLSRWVVRV